MPFPTHRPRRLRESALTRDLVRETRLGAHDLIYPLFVIEGTGQRVPIATLPGQDRLSVDQLVEECRRAADLGIKAVLLFGIPNDGDKDEQGSAAWDPGGIVQRAIRAIRSSGLPLLVITDVCLCEYTSHGHCGLVRDGRVLNDPSLELYCKMALSHAAAGADWVAPSDMMDGRVGAIRRALDESGHGQLPILAYSAKYASAFYGPFRDACGSAPAFGDRRSHQMDPANAEEALREIALDLEEGADIVMVKPALAYLDIIRRAKERFGVPLAAYNVSGEYAMIEFAARAGAGDRERLVMEVLTSIRRAGADLILTYHAPLAAELIGGS
ncbi:MAG: porphobilinogen synthase [Polyangia bacterium]|jgi:porphobilinogen synthase|nr:porphobilinogen synthase [Polyangia bacterium]